MREQAMYEKKKEYLRSYQERKLKVRRLTEELQIHEISPSFVLSVTPSAGNKRDLSDYIVRYDNLVTKIITAKQAAAEQFDTLHEQIEQLEDENQKTVLVLRYLRNMTWEEIAEEMLYSYRTVHRIHGKALEKFELPLL